VYKRRVGTDGLPFGDVLSHKVRAARDSGTIAEIKSEVDSKQGCNVYGTLMAQKVAGNFHFSLHAQVREPMLHPFSPPDSRVTPRL
jgi:hypothetical protein